jgi:2-hydroxychromene-2-carboxylate isomerase
VIRICFDFVSPYAYVAWFRLHGIAAKHGQEVEAVPVLFAALLKANGTRGPAEVPAKRAYVFKDAARGAHAAGLRFGMPPAHPFNPLLALRAVHMVEDRARRKRLVDELYKAVWGKGGPGVTEPAVVAAVAERAGLDGADLIQAAESDTAKARLRAATDAAIADGAFGVPTMWVNGEMFWGNDSLDHMDRFLAGTGP